MGLPDAMAVLAQEWDDVLGYLDAGQVSRLRELVAGFVAEGDAGRSGDIPDDIMNLLMEALPVSHPVVTALMSTADRFAGRTSVAADPAWLQLAGPLRARLDAMPEGPGEGSGPGSHPGAAVKSAPAQISVEIYLDTDDRVVAAQVFEAADSLLWLLGYDGPFDEEIIYGSILRRAKAVAKAALTSEELTTRVAKVERALELEYLDQRQADVDLREAEAVRRLIGSLAEVPQACLRVGSILVVKYQDAGGPVVLTRNLSQLELHALARFPEIQNDPPRTLNALATAVSTAELREAD